MNAPVAPDPLRPWPDTVAWRPISARYFLVRLAVLGVWVLILTLAALAAAVLWSAWCYAAAVAIVTGGALRAVFLRRSIRAWGYAERAEDLLVRHGLLVRRLSIVPYARMQFVDVTAGPIERAAGLATVTLHTAAAASDATVPGLEAAEATRLRDRLAALGEIREEGL
ncbi:PH domain-containing protein [Dactylosporangium sp. NPDC000244]|uniref:PH domain-containing protein n=1 Tax=Dactylosporangium sp. NPDC000244 TaxID=3154365 RepID=UPI0033277567